MEKEKEETDDELSMLTVRLKELSLVPEEELHARLERVPRQQALLMEAIGQFTTRACGNLNKIYEVAAVPAVRRHFAEEHYDVYHVRHHYGSDLRVVDRRTGEERGLDVKHSCVTAKKKYRSNWCFELNAKTVAVCHHPDTGVSKKAGLVARLYQSMERRMPNGGYALLVAHSGDGVEVANYLLSGHFVAFYCVNKCLRANSSAQNMGSQRCPTCGHYHRALQLQEYSRQLVGRIESQTAGVFLHDYDYFSEAEAEEILNTQLTSRCSAPDPAPFIEKVEECDK